MNAEISLALASMHVEDAQELDAYAHTFTNRDKNTTRPTSC